MEPPPKAGGDAEEDRISALPDDQLLQIIKQLGCPRAAARTGILSQRWRGLWTGIPRVTVTLNQIIDPGELEAALARAACAGLHLLDITVPSCGQTITACEVAAILAAADRLCPLELRFSLKRTIRYRRSAVYLPRFSRATSITMNGLLDLELTPSASGLPALERLTLFSEGGLRLANLIPHCPSLRVLDLSLEDSVKGLTIHSTSVEELRVSNIKGCIMDIMAPMLKQMELTIGTSCARKTIAISISAPLMEKLSWCCDYEIENSVANIVAFPCNGMLWCLENLKLRAVQPGTIPYNMEDDTCLYLPIYPTCVCFLAVLFHFTRVFYNLNPFYAFPLPTCYAD
jgi:hypothetical protein